MNKKLIIFDLDDTLYDTSGRIDEDMPNFAEMKLLPWVRETLETIKIKKILLTQGVRNVQNKKIDVLGIRDLFEEIVIVAKGEDKLAFFDVLAKEYEDPKVVLVVGDRRDKEIRYGNQVGFTTVLVSGFKYKDLVPKDDFEIPTHKIETFVEVINFL